jgi:hypothetical protein
MTTPRQRASQVGRKARSYRHGKAYVRTNRRHRWSGFPRQAGGIERLIALAAPAGIVEKEVVRRLLCGATNRELPLGRQPRRATRQTARSQLAKPATTRLSPRDAPIFCVSLTVSSVEHESRHFCARALQKSAQRNSKEAEHERSAAGLISATEAYVVSRVSPPRFALNSLI